MAIQPIGGASLGASFTSPSQIDLELAEREARGVGRGVQQLQAVGSDIAGSIDDGLRSAEILQKRAIDEDKEVQVKALLDSGIKGIKTYADEQGVDPTPFVKMASLSKTPENIKNAYFAIHKAGQLEQAKKTRLELMGGISSEYQNLVQTDSVDESKLKSFANKVNIAKTNTTDPATIKQLESIEKGVNFKLNRAGKKDTAKKDAFKLTADKLKLTRDESAFFEDKIKEAKIIRDKTEGVRASLSRVMEDVKSGKSANFAAVDQVLGVTLQKVLDPPSVVRESEFARIGLTQAKVDSLEGFFRKIVEGGIGLSNKGRQVITQFIEDMNSLSESTIKKGMLTMATRSDFGERYPLNELDATLFDDKSVQFLKDVRDKKQPLEEDNLRERLEANIELFLKNPDVLSTKEAQGEAQVAIDKDEVITPVASATTPSGELVKTGDKTFTLGEYKIEVE
jgi:hypothetical protein